MKRLVDAIQADIERELYDGAVIMVAKAGDVAVREALGFADRAGGRPMHEDDVFAAFSISKSITAVAVLQRLERGELRLTTPVAELIPEFAVKGKERVTIAQLLSHTGGMPSAFPDVPVAEQGDLDKVVAAVCQTALENVPGEVTSYSPIMAHAILGETVRRLDGGGMALRDIFRRDLLEPLAMNHTALGMRIDLAGRAVPAVVRDRRPGMFDPEGIEATAAVIMDPEAGAEIPAAGFVATAGDIMRFAEALRRGGELDGRRILSPATVRLATQNHTGLLPNNLYNFAREMRGWPAFPAYLGLGFNLRGEGIHPTYFGSLASPSTFGGIGAGSTLFWVDPERAISFVCMTSGLLEETHSCDRFQRLSDMAIAALS
jgi:CubicO group peptidase (beta-lactamase class C family)